MEYAQLNEALTEATQITTHGNVEWDNNHLCPASALTPAEATQFRVVPLTETEQPVFNAMTHRCYRDGCEKIGDNWQYKWAVVALSVEEAEANLAALRTTKITAIKAERDRRKFNGVYVSNKWIQSDTYSRTQWMAMVMMGANVPIIEWTTMDSTSITTSQTLANEVFQATATLDATLFAYAKSLITSVNASSDPVSIDITAGWPDTYVA